MNNQAIIILEKEMQAGTEAEKSYLADYLENKAVPPEYLDYCRAWERAYFQWEAINNHRGRDYES